MPKADIILATTALEFFPSIPRNLPQVLASQLERYMAIRAFDALNIGEDEYHTTLQNAIEAFIWNEEQAQAGLLDVAIFDCRLTGKYLAKIGGVSCRLHNPDECANREGITTPPGVYIAQIQLGPKWKGLAPFDCLSQFAPCELGMTTKEGLTILALRGREYMRSRLSCCMDLVGSVYEDSTVPHLSPGVDIPFLGGDEGDRPYPNFGSASRGSVS